MTMGNLLASLLPLRAQRRLRKAWATAYWFTSNTAWILATAGITLAAPIIFQYEKECQLFEMQAQFFQQQQQQQALLNAAGAAAGAAAGGAIGSAAAPL